MSRRAPRPGAPAGAAPGWRQPQAWKAWGALLAFGVLAYALLVHPWFTAPMLAMREEIIQLRDQELTARMVLTRREAIEARLLELQSDADADPGFLAEGSAELAVAGLVQRVESVVAEGPPGAGRCTVGRSVPKAIASDERYPRVTLEVQLRCGMADLGRVMQALEGGRPRLFVGKVMMLSRRDAALAVGETPGVVLVDISFELAGYLRTPTEEAPRRGR